MITTQNSLRVTIIRTNLCPFTNTSMIIPVLGDHQRRYLLSITKLPGGGLSGGDMDRQDLSSSIPEVGSSKVRHEFRSGKQSSR